MKKNIHTQGQKKQKKAKIDGNQFDGDFNSRRNWYQGLMDGCECK